MGETADTLIPAGAEARRLEDAALVVLNRSHRHVSISLSSPELTVKHTITRMAWPLRRSQDGRGLSQADRVSG